LSIHDAVVMGRLADAKQPAGYLAKHWPDQVLETWIPFVRSLRSTAAEVEHAENLQAAAKGTADLALSCGECHEALDDGPTFDPPPEPPAGDEAAAVMHRHRWATDRLWEGVVQPSTERWMQGIDALQRLPDCQEDPGGEQLTADIEAARAATERVRLQAKDATDLRDRARLYGELLGTCSTCHLAGC
jgi:cytochrome c553